MITSLDGFVCIRLKKNSKHGHHHSSCIRIADYCRMAFLESTSVHLAKRGVGTAMSKQSSAFVFVMVAMQHVKFVPITWHQQFVFSPESFNSSIGSQLGIGTCERGWSWGRRDITLNCADTILLKDTACAHLCHPIPSWHECSIHHGKSAKTFVSESSFKIKRQILTCVLCEVLNAGRACNTVTVTACHVGTIFITGRASPAPRQCDLFCTVTTAKDT